jgi:ribA/ribD-fused uncharacterized protein
MSQYHFFYGGPLSQWQTCRFTIDGLDFNCAEQAMMYYKAILFGDATVALAIMKSQNAREQKALGRQVSGFDEAVWLRIARVIVARANFAKFTQNPDAWEALASTWPLKLVEASPSDKLWGIGLSSTDPRAQHQEQWRGSNWLGDVLTDVRNDLLRLEKAHYPVPNNLE